MILSSDELEILDYLKSWEGKHVSMVEVCRCAGGRRKYRENANWARGLMARLVDEKLIEVNERGHYRYLVENAAKEMEDYFPAAEEPLIVGENYFPPPEPLPEVKDEVEDEQPERWISPHIETILKKAGKKVGKSKRGH